MYLQTDECVIREYHHHPFRFFVRAVKILTVSFPFFFLAFLFRDVFSTLEIAGIYTVIAIIFLAIAGYSSLIFYLDRLVMTNQRVIHIDWHGLFARDESEAEYSDIQDIETRENGILSNLKIFDYGYIIIQTASKKISIMFEDANDPEGIKHFIYHLQRKPATIRLKSFAELNNDSAQSKPEKDQEESIAFSGSKK